MDKEFIKYLGIIVGGLVSFILVLIAIIYVLDKNVNCPSYGRMTQLEYKYNFLAGGCFVNYEGQWIKKESLRAGKLD